MPIALLGGIWTPELTLSLTARPLLGFIQVWLALLVTLSGFIQLSLALLCGFIRRLHALLVMK